MEVLLKMTPEPVGPLDAAPVSRRDLLVGTGAFAAGAALAALFGRPSVAGAAEVPPWPWPYRPLDPDVAARLGYEGYWQGGCMYGAAKAIIGQLAQIVGHPYTLVPLDMFRYGAGGFAGWGTLCGALNGAGAAVALVTPKEAHSQILGELTGWYTQTAFPIYRPAGQAALATSVAGSPLCHVSVSKWCAAAGAREDSQERKERCARLTGDVAAYTVRLLNAYHQGTFSPAFALSPETAGCLDCHGAAGMSDTLGKMECVDCHTPHT